MASGNMQYGNNNSGNDSAGDFTTLTSAVTTSTQNQATLIVTNNGAGNALRGRSPQGFGVAGSSDVAAGVSGVSQNKEGVSGSSTSDNGVKGKTSSAAASGVYGENLSGSGGFGIAGRINTAVGPFPFPPTPFHAAVLGDNTAGGFAGRFFGNVDVQGFVTKKGGGFRIDHPVDPANRFLTHSFVESPHMMNIYNGNATTDDAGDARVELPAYFGALNTDFRYQLTVIGQFAQAIVASPIEDNRFQIKTDLPNVAVSWQVTGIRQDPWAVANPIETETDKDDYERDRFLSPEEHDQPRSTWMYAALREDATIEDQ